MQLLNLKDQLDIVKVVEYLVEIHQKNNTVGDVMKRFGLGIDEYRMCCNLAVPALRQGNIKGRFTALSRINRAMRRDIRTLYEAVKDEDGSAADGVRELYRRYCDHSQNAVFACAQDEADR
jgi:hypothetical protein